MLLVNFMKDKKKKGCGQGQEDEESDESDNEEVMIYFRALIMRIKEKSR